MVEGPRIGFIGAGRAAAALGTALARSGYPVVVVGSLTSAHAETVAALINEAGQENTSRAAEPQTVAEVADLVLITTPDTAIAEVVSSLHWRRAQAVVHCSGVLTTEALLGAREQGAYTGSWHPFQTLTGRATLAGATFGIEAEGELYDTLDAMTRAVGGEPMPVPAAARVLYHAASVLSCGYLTTLLRDARRLWEKAGLPPEAGRQAIATIAEATVANVRAAGEETSLTGPTSRGDTETVRRHLEAVAAGAPELLPLYVAISERSVRLAREAERTIADEAEWAAVFRPFAPGAPDAEVQEA